MVLVKIVVKFSFLWIPLPGLEPNFQCFPRDGAAVNRNDSLLNQCVDNDVQKCRIAYTSQYKSFASEVTINLFLLKVCSDVFLRHLKYFSDWINIKICILDLECNIFHPFNKCMIKVCPYCCAIHMTLCINKICKDI